MRPRSSQRKRVVVAGLGDTGLLIATRLARHFDVVGIATRPALFSGQELGQRLTDPAGWSRNFFVPFARLRRLDAVEQVHGRLVGVDFASREVDIERAEGKPLRVPFDSLVIATGASNGFWRHDRVETLAEVEQALGAPAQALAEAKTVAIVGGGPTGVSVAANLARRGHRNVHLFWSGELPLPHYHPRARRWMVQVLHRDGVVLHPHHRAAPPAGTTTDRLGSGPVHWSTGQPPFSADVVLWATGHHRPHSGFLAGDFLDVDGFIRVDETLQLHGHPGVFAVGDVAATDPLRSSARNWGWRKVVANVHVHLRGRGRLRRFSAPPYRWGSVLGLQHDGLVIVRPNGRRVRIPRAVAEPLLFRGFTRRYLYGGVRGPN